MKSGRNGTNRELLSTASEANVHRLLKELHEKKRWLDVLIQALEAAEISPHHQLIDSAERIFERLNGDRPKVDLRPQQQRILADLASRIGRPRSRRVLRPVAHAA
ncbi:MAG: hypothetical protein WD733_03930 [Bryobacterales bacterium]